MGGSENKVHLFSEVAKHNTKGDCWLLVHGKAAQHSTQNKREKKKMAVVIIDGSTLRNFVNDESEFNRSVTERFKSLDLNNDGVLSNSELRKSMESFRLIETHFGSDVVMTADDLTKLYDSIFEKFDYDHSGTVDMEEFKNEMRKIMVAIADGLGSNPIQMVVEDSFLKQAADLEASKAIRASSNTTTRTT